MSAIEKGATVRVSYPAEYVRMAVPTGRHMISIAGQEWMLPPGAEVEVISPPPLPEPPDDAVLRDAAGVLWVKFSTQHWRSVSGDRLIMTWGDLHGLNGPLVRLVPEPEPHPAPVAIHDGRVLWLHACGTTKRYPVIGCKPSHDPNNPRTPELATPRCASDCPQSGARWTPLVPDVTYVERSDG